LHALPYVAFFLSGASSLIFQALWTRMLHHTFGATSVAMSSVLTAFMGGLGLGAHLFGRRAGRFAQPLRVYAACELSVAVCALLIPLLVESDGPVAFVNAFLRQELGASSFAFMLARFLCVLPLLLVPTTLMGGTLPLLAQHFVGNAQTSAARESDSVNATAKVGALYAVNTFGAVAGSLLGSFVLMPAVGVHATNLVAVAINAGLGLFILALARPRSAATSPGPVRAAAAPEPSLVASTFGSGEEPLASTTQPATRPAWLRPAAALAFACSGACAMAYEVVWSRALSMAIGSSLQAFALILVTFLVGIAAGSALLSSFLVSHARDSESSDAPGRSPLPGMWALGSAAWVLSALALAPAWVLSNAALAWLVWAGCGLLIGLSLASAARELRTSQALDVELAQELSLRLPRRGRWLLALPSGIALFEAGRFSLSRGAELGVVQHGYLPYITAAVVLSLVAFLWLASSFRHAPWTLACAIQLFVACATLLTCIFQDEIPYTFARLVSSVADLPSHVGTVRFFMFFAASLCTLPPTLGMGAMFPVTLELWRSTRPSGQAASERDVGADVGRIYAANTLGSILGAWLPGFLLLPWIGMQRTLDAGITLNALVACLMLVAARHAGERLVRAQLALASLGAGFLLFVVSMLCQADPPLRWNLSHMTLGAFRVSLAKTVLDVNSWGKSDMVYYRDGISTTVSVERWGSHLLLKNNGKVDASNGNDMPTQIMVAAYPLLLHPRGARDLDVAVVGFGSGVTVGATLQFPVRHVEAMELERAVVEAGVDFFSEVNHLTRKRAAFPYVDEPRLSLHSDDGRNFLASTSHKYDVIISEPSNPWITGVSDLFTTEHFRVTKRRLKPGGVYCQWVQLYEMSPDSIKIIYRTFASQFRYVAAFAVEELSTDTILVGSDVPLPLDADHVAEAMRDPRVAAELERAYIHSPYDVWSRMLFASREEILRFAQHEQRRDKGVMTESLRASGNEPCKAPDCVRQPVPINSDDNMLIELRAPADLIGFARYSGYLRLFYGLEWPYGRPFGKLRGIDRPEARAQLTLALLAQGRKQHARPYVAALASDTLPAAVEARRVAQYLLGALPEPRFELEPPVPGPYLSPSARTAFELAVALSEQQLSSGDARAALRTLLSPNVSETLRHFSGPGFRYFFALVLYRSAGDDRGQLKEAAAKFEELIREDEPYARAHPELYYFLAKAQDAAFSFDKAVRNMRAYVVRAANESAHRE
jgi:spermidine synthase